VLGAQQLSGGATAPFPYGCVQPYRQPPRVGIVGPFSNQCAETRKMRKESRVVPELERRIQGVSVFYGDTQYGSRVSQCPKLGNGDL